MRSLQRLNDPDTRETNDGHGWGQRIDASALEVRDGLHSVGERDRLHADRPGARNVSGTSSTSTVSPGGVQPTQTRGDRGSGCATPPRARDDRVAHVLEAEGGEVRFAQTELGRRAPFDLLQRCRPGVSSPDAGGRALKPRDLIGGELERAAAARPRRGRSASRPRSAVTPGLCSSHAIATRAGDSPRPAATSSSRSMTSKSASRPYSSSCTGSASPRAVRPPPSRVRLPARNPRASGL